MGIEGKTAVALRVERESGKEKREDRSWDRDGREKNKNEMRYNRQ